MAKRSIFIIAAVFFVGCAGVAPRPQAARMPIAAAVSQPLPLKIVVPEPPPVEPAPEKSLPLCDASSAQPCMTLTPNDPRPGDLVMVDVFAAASDSATVTLFGSHVPLYHFAGHFRGFAAVPLRALAVPETPELDLESKTGHAAFHCAEANVEAREFPYEELHVARRFARHTAVDASAQDEEPNAMVFGHETPLTQAGLFLWPKEGDVTAVFGERRLFNHKLTSRHLGLDIHGAVGDRVFASQAGVVRFSGRKRASGETLIVDHGGGLLTYYMHLSKRLKVGGQHVKQGEIIGLVGRTGRVTGPHLHFAVSVHGRYVDPQEVLAHPMFATSEATPCHPADTASAR